MLSQLGWVDFSRSHRDKVMSVMDMFKEKGMIDELGLGTIRDSLSDHLFPGTSTIQTRAKYFLLIPWIIQDLESRGRFDRFQSELEEAEIAFVKTLHKNSPGRNSGVIGRTLANANPKRKPTSIYWNGLRIYGILKFPGSLTDYINHLREYHKKKKKLAMQSVEAEGNADKTGDDRDAMHLYLTHQWAQLPSPPQDWKSNLKMELEYEEAIFLKERIIFSRPDSLWAFTLREVPQQALTFASIEDFLALDNLPDQLRKLVKLAVDFNKLMQGAVIYYNYLVQKNREKGLLEGLSMLWQNYLLSMQKFDWNSWDIGRLWHFCPYQKEATELFVTNWISLLRQPVFDPAKAEILLRNRELRLKGFNRARLSDKSIAQRQDSITGMDVNDEEVTYLTYRWSTAKTFLQDIHNVSANASSY